MRCIFRSSCVLFILFWANQSSGQPASMLTLIKNNDLPEIKAQLAKHVSLAERDSAGDNVLMYAALYSTAECMEVLLKSGTDPNATNKIGETALFWCSGDFEKTRLLLNHKAKTDVVTNKGNTPLLTACLGNNQQEIISLLLQHGADARAKNKRGVTTLIQLAGFGDTMSAAKLLALGADINAKTKDSVTALFVATRHGHRDMVKWLINNGADVNSMDNYKATALAYGVVHNDQELVTLLLNKIKDLNAPDLDGMTLLMWAVYSEYDNPAIIQAFLDKKVALNSKDKNGQTALDWAKKKGNTATVALLKSAGAE